MTPIGFKIIGAHTDSPCLRLAPVSKLESNKMHQTYVNTYGGGLWHTWFDRDLTLGGRVVYKSEQGYDYKLYHHAGPLIKIPNLAIHLTTADERKFAPNSESHLRPILSSEVYNQLTGLKDEKEKKDGAQGKHYYQLLQMVAKSLGIDVDAITDLDFYLSDSNPGTLFGMNQEFISAPRIDNLISTFFCVKAIAAEQAHNAESSFVNMVCLFDHEEVGSTSAQGANSTLMENSLKRIFQVMSSEDNSCKPDSFFKALQRSFQISSDVSHGVHPNYAEKHQTNHKVKINEGIVLKTNCNQRYATDSVSLTLLRAVADSANVPIQDFVVKNDSPCGSTIGPLTGNSIPIHSLSCPDRHQDHRSRKSRLGNALHQGNRRRTRLRVQVQLVRGVLQEVRADQPEAAGLVNNFKRNHILINNVGHLLCFHLGLEGQSPHHQSVPVRPAPQHPGDLQQEAARVRRVHPETRDDGQGR